MKCCLFVLCILTSYISQAQPGSLQELIARAKTEKDTTQVNTLIDIAATYSYNGAHDSSDYYTQQILEKSTQLNYPKGICMAYNAWATSYMVQGNYDKSLAEYFKALDIAEKNGLEQAEIIMTMNIATVYTFQEEFNNAIPLLKKVYNYVFNKKHNIMRSAGVATNIGVCFQHLGRMDSARAYFDRGLELEAAIDTAGFTETKWAEYELLKGSSLPKTADFYVGIGNPRKALDLILPFWNDIKKGDDKEGQLSVLTVLGKSYLAIDKYDSVIYYSNIGLGLNMAEQIPESVKDIYFNIASAYNKTGHFKEAFESQLRFQQLNDSIYNKEKFRSIKNMQVKYETEKKEQQILSLNKEKKDQFIIIGISIAAFLIALVLLLFVLRSKRFQKELFRNEKLLQNNELERKMTELEQTALRAQMNPHFIFNCLNSVQRFVIKGDIEGVNTYLATFAGLIRQTLENSGKKWIVLKDEIQYLQSYLGVEQMRGNTIFQYQVTVDPALDTSMVLVPGMIIQPFVENAINHGMSGKAAGAGRIILDFTKTDKLVCSITDNGNGIKNSGGLANAAHQSLGNDITKKRIAAYNALEQDAIELDITDLSEKDAATTGTMVRISFPLKINEA
ncbi:histidine kinase [Ferruginibacter sp.]